MRKFDQLYTQLVEAMDRRQFIKLMGRGAAITGVAPKGLLGKAVMNLATGTPINLTTIISNHLLTNTPVFAGKPYEGVIIDDINEIAKGVDHLEGSYGVIINALQNSGVSLPPSLLAAATTIFNNINDVKGMIEYSKANSEEIPEGLAIEEGERMLNDIYDPDGPIYEFNQELIKYGFENNKINAEAQKNLEDNYEIFKCDYVNDPASKARKDKIEAENKRRAEEWKKEEHQRQQKNTAKNINYSRFDTAGGSEDEGYAKYWENYKYKCNGKKIYRNL